MVNYDKFDRIVQEEEEEELKTQIEGTEQLATAFKESGNKSYGEGKLADAVGAYTSGIVVLTGERDPRLKPSVVDVTEEEEAKEKKVVSGKEAGMPEGVTAIDPTQYQKEAEPVDPMSEMGRTHEQNYASDYEVQKRMERAAAFLQRSEKLRTLLATCYSNRSLASVGLSEGKEKEFKEKVTSAQGGIDKWDSYRVRMTVDSLNDTRVAVQLDPTNHKAWYRIGYCIYRLVFLIDRIRERKPWLKEDELPLLEKPAMWEEARTALVKSLELNESQATYEKLKEVYECIGKMTMIVRKLGHENLGIDVDDSTMILKGVDEDSPAKKWGIAAFIGCKITHLKIGDEGALLPVTDVLDLSKRQTYASYVTLGFLPTEAPPPIPCPPGGKKPDVVVAEEEASVPASVSATETVKASTKYGPLPPRNPRATRTPRQVFQNRVMAVPAVIILLLAILMIML